LLKIRHPKGQALIVLMVIHQHCYESKGRWQKMRLEGKQIGRYRFEQLIGRGAMGEVYLAVDPRINQQVAVKVLQAEPAVYPAANEAREAERFRREASAIANLRHPHIVPLYDYNETSIDDTAITYLVIPYYLEGSFASWLRRRGSNLIPMEDVVYFVQQAADALQYAHNHQVIHRDVKPSNFLIDISENPNRPNLLLADFGISKFALGTTASGTQSLGTLTYMPPEQLNGRPTYASDQYALAIMAYELLVGHPPFEGPPPVVIRQHLEDQPQPPSMLNPGLPSAIDRVLLRALEKKPENRYPTISEFARALQQALPGTRDIPNIQPESSIGERERSGEVREAQKGSDIRATLRISPEEAQRGTDRIVNLPGGRQVTVTVPANAYNGQVLDFPGLGEPSPSGGQAGNLILTLSIVQQEQTPLTTPPQPQPGTDVLQGGAPQPKADIPDIPIPKAPPPDTLGGTKRNRRTIAIASGIVPVVLVLALVFYAVSRQGSNAGNGTVTVDATATIIAQNPDPYPPMNRTLAGIDPLSDNSHGDWDVNSDKLGTCAFTGGAYHVTAIPQPGSGQQPGKGCALARSNFIDGAYQVQMTIVKGDGGGIFFRDDGNGNGYYFFIGQNGTYELGIYNNCNNCTFKPLRNGSSAAIHKGLNQSNLVAVVASGSTIDLYVNNQKIDSVSDSSYSQGAAGVFATVVNGPTEVMFNNAKVWT
jgi:eukaryotic-like serine/threonine-protein kinase